MCCRIDSDDATNLGLVGGDEWYLSSPDALPGVPSSACSRTDVQMSLTTALFECGGKAAAVSTNFFIKAFRYKIDKKVYLIEAANEICSFIFERDNNVIQHAGQTLLVCHGTIVLLYFFQYVCLLIKIGFELKFFTKKKNYRVFSRQNKELSSFCDFKIQFVLNHKVVNLS